MRSCNRCGRRFASPAAIKMHLRLKHFNKVVCDRCGNEVGRRKLQSHITSSHPCEEDFPEVFKSSKSLVPVATTNEAQSFWEVPSARLSWFVVPGTSLRCRLCGHTLGGVHGREQHERDVHRFTTQKRNSLALRLRPWNFLDMLAPCDVRDYVVEELRTPLAGTPECNSDVNVLVNFLIEELPAEVSFVARGGSYGKGTCLRGHSDIDMVLFIEGIPLFGGSAASVQRLSAFLSEAKRRLQRSLLATRVLISEVTRHALRFQYKCVGNSHIHHVDLIPCNDLLGQKPTKVDKLAVYDLMGNCKSAHEMQMLNASILHLQVEFVRRRPMIVRDLIRLVKQWRRTSFGEVTSQNRFRRLPNSYALELITIHAWELAGKPISFELRRGFAAVLRILVNYESLCAVWLENYDRHCRWLNETLKSEKPIVVDPASPLNNVCDNTNCWDEIGYVAKQSLGKPLFKSMKRPREWS